MILIIGGCGQGKLSYAKQAYGVCHTDIAAALGEQRVVYQLHHIVKSMVEQGQDPLAVIAHHAAKHPHTIYICDEIGCGAVPIDPQQRAWREAVGRCCCMLGEKAERVERIFCGIPLVLKGGDRSVCK